ncbi:Predicted O-methyltransferase YrrM [Gracilibacillus ureilyticus]|uniref:tRNA 5-hydroxyuridine methyltransferase n=1 Tax=Gracilibacillus ureilyticus TaxID=531814 RepID=A0A1H9RMD2_9BACI|nr:O-methyltransferase [Gracilibacillus ureilyticus]SER73253.1 Predicted O-methyltransferase YrrM [Gracilibacillus ureilyticus]
MIDPSILSYLEKLHQADEKWIKELEEEARQHHVPIMDKVGISFLLQLIRMKQPGKILEIGAAIGYSSLRMANAYNQTKIVTIERDQEMYERASYHVAKHDKANQIEILFGDALELEDQVQQRAPYDLIFIDAAKGQYQKFFTMYEKMLSPGGVIITDNVLFRGLVAGHLETTKRIEKLAEKIDRYNQWLMDHSNYHTTIIPVGDGVAVSVPKEHEEVSS